MNLRAGTDTKLRSALISDVLDSLGFRNQCLGPDIVPLGHTSYMTGYAYTVETRAIDHIPDEPYVGLLEVVDGVKPSDLIVIPTQREAKAAVWGELVSTASKSRGGAGLLTDGYVRDIEFVDLLSFPVFATGSTPYDITGRYEISGRSREATIDGVTVHDGDLIVADRDGVVIVPRALEDKVRAAAAEKDAKEAGFREAVRNGMLPSDAFRKFGVL